MAKSVKFDFKKNSTSKIIAILISIFAITYFVYQIYMISYKPFETEVALIHDYTDQISVKGIVLKQEQIIENETNGIVKYEKRESSKIVSGTEIATVYSNENDLKNNVLIKSKQEHLNLLTSLQEKKQDIISNYQNITSSVKEQQINFVDAIQNNDFDNISGFEMSLLEQMLKQEIIINNDISYDEQIATLTSEIQQLNQSVSSTGQVVSAPVSGYFTQNVDGFENITYDTATADLSVDAVKKLINQEYNYQTDKIGKIITSTNWNFLGIFDGKYIEKLQEGLTVQLIFPQDPSYTISATIEKITYNEGDKEGTVLLSSSNMGDNVVDLRLETPSIVLKKSSGIKVPKSALRIVDIEEKTQDGQTVSVSTPGVYVSLGQIVKFKKVNISFETNDYVICSIQDSSDYLQIYDQIILESEGLYDGKPI